MKALHCSATRERLAMDSSGVTRTTPEFPPSLLSSTPHRRENVSALKYLTCIGFSGTIVTRIRWLLLPCKFKASPLLESVWRWTVVEDDTRVLSASVPSHLPVDGVRFLAGQKGVALQLQDARVGVGSTKDAARCWKWQRYTMLKLMTRVRYLDH
ncbi:hypothetical protein TNCV_3024231 [Trichonephila clavipes]|nr:hypothetical protein TNCV_3024231 [Trichonephila clavipes]